MNTAVGCMWNRVEVALQLHAFLVFVDPYGSVDVEVAVAFVGGKLPLVGWTIKGGPLFGLWFLLTIDPLLMTTAWLAFLFVGLLIVSVAIAAKALTQLALGQR